MWVHIGAGAFALVSGALALLVKKGSVLHKRVGVVFFVSMLLCGTASLVLAFMSDKDFLLVVGVFSLYLTLAGFNALRVLRSSAARVSGQLLSATMALGVAGFIVLGIDSLQQSNTTGGVVLLVFAALAGFLVWQDYQFFRFNRYNPLTLHIGRMVGAWIAAFSAFLVVNGTLQPPLLNWLLPTAIGVPVIVFWIRKKAAA